jgi:hypothetical protein
MNRSTLFQATVLTVLTLVPSGFSQSGLADNRPPERPAPPTAPLPPEASPPSEAESSGLQLKINEDVRGSASAERPGGQAGSMRVELRERLSPANGGHSYGYGAAPSSADQPLIVSSQNLKSAELDEIREDMRIMAKLLEDSIADSGDHSTERRAMGIVVQTFSGGASRDLFISGHGAIFQNSVGFPLAAPAGKETKEADKPKTRSDWEAARREVRGERDPLDPFAGPERGPEFSGERVESLKKGVLKALANTHNFRHLSADDTVTVVVTSMPSETPLFGQAQAMGIPGSGMGGGYGGLGSMGATTLGTGAGRSSAPAPSPTTMTITVKQSDAAALSEGKITEDEFRTRAKIAVY